MMKNKFLLGALAMFGALSVIVSSCKDEQDIDSVAQVVNLPYVFQKNMNDAYVYGQGQATLEADLPDVVAVVCDTVYGFEGGYGGKTGADFYDIKKSEILGGYPDLSQIGGVGINFEKYNKGGYKVATGAAVVIAGTIPNPGPTALEGSYKRTSNGYVIQIKKVFDGVYVIDNLGGANVPPFPFLLYNHKSSIGLDSLAFPVQTNECGSGTCLVAPGAVLGGTAADYAKTQPPSITLGPPVTLKWKVYTMTGTSASSITSAGLCTWGNTATRTFEKQ